MRRGRPRLSAPYASWYGQMAPAVGVLDAFVSIHGGVWTASSVRDVLTARWSRVFDPETALRLGVRTARRRRRRDATHWQCRHRAEAGRSPRRRRCAATPRSWPTSRTTGPAARRRTSSRARRRSASRSPRTRRAGSRGFPQNPRMTSTIGGGTGRRRATHRDELRVGIARLRAGARRLRAHPVRRDAERDVGELVAFPTETVYGLGGQRARRGGGASRV